MIAEVIIEISHQNIDKVFHYIIPKNLETKVKIGLRVNVPFGKGNKKIQGYIIGFSDISTIEYTKLKSLYNIVDNYPLFDEHMVELAKWMKDYYGARMIDCLKCMMPPFMKITSEKYICINKEISLEKTKKIIEEYKNKKRYHAQARILSFLMDNKEIPLSEIKKILQISSSSIKSLINKNLIQIKEVDLDKDPYDGINFKQTKPLIPTHEQKNVIQYIIEKLNHDRGEEILLHGITGSGKTEIYLQLIDEVIKIGGQAIVLVPEISLTPQTVERFKSRFGGRVAFTHSKLSQGERFAQWKKAKEGKVSVMIGPRSAVFTPFSSLKLIILDEEHETTYKSEIAPKYHAKEVAKKRCDMMGGVCLRASATPSLDSYYEAKQGKVKLLTISNRVNDSKLPQVDIIDMREELEKGNRSIFSATLREEIQKNLDKKEQVILFLNRRGFSNFVSCRKCGYVLKCKNCNISYTYHAYNNSLQCHYCGDKMTVPSVCPQCGSAHIKYFGVGTEKVEEAVKKEFPKARVLRMDLDTAKGKYGYEKILNKFKSMEADILIGTQMIAKGHDFPNVTLVGILAADLTLHVQDFRSAEKTFQLLTQVSGRAGRGNLPGRVLVQTYAPDHYSIQTARKHDYLYFYNKEINLRQQLNYPPFTHIFSILITGEKERDVITSIYKLMDIMKFFNRKNNFELYGPTPAIISKIKNKYRWRILIKCKDRELLMKYSLYCINKFNQTTSNLDIRVQTDIDPLIMI